MLTKDQSLSILSDVLKDAQTLGAEAADAIIASSRQVGVGVRLGQLENLERNESFALGLRVLIGKRQAIVSSSDLDHLALKEITKRAIEMAKVVPEVPYVGLAESSQIATQFENVDGYDPTEPSTESMKQSALQCEDAARAVKGVTNSDGAGVSWGEHAVALAATNGFEGFYQGSSNSIYASVLAEQDGKKETDYDYSVAVYSGDLVSPEQVGTKAGEKTVKRIGARKVKTTSAPVIFDPIVSKNFVSYLTGAVNGQSIILGTSFLKDSLGKKIMNKGIKIIDDPLRPRGLSSKPFDGEGLATRPLTLVDNGVLESWILDLATARQLKMKSTAHASRGFSSAPSPSSTNTHLEAGIVFPNDLRADIKQGLYVTSIMGSPNLVTGDMSVGASGFWIENGEITYPVSEITIAGNLKEIFLEMTPANDLEFKYSTNAPTLRVEKMTIAGT